MRWFSFSLAAVVAAAVVFLAVTAPGDRFGPRVAAVTAGVWLLASGARFYWRRQRGVSDPLGPITSHALGFFVLILGAVYTTYALDAADVQLRPSPDQPDFMPGLFTNLTVYYLVAQAGVTLLIALYGQTPRRAIEAALAAQLVFLAPLYESVLQNDVGAPLLLGGALVIAAYALSERRELGIDRFHWTPFGAPLAAFVAVAFIATIPAAYVQHSLIVTSKLAALAVLALVIMNLVREQRQIWLLGAALVLPTAGMAVQMLWKLVEIGNHMGIEYAVRFRYQFFGVVGANDVGFAFAIAIVLIIFGLFRAQRTSARIAIASLLVPIAPAMLSLRSSSGLVALGAGLAILLAAALSREFIGAARRYINPATVLAALAIAGAVAAVVIIPNAYTAAWQDEVSDPTTGRGVREHVWSWSSRDIRHHLLLGIGPADRRFEPRAEFVPEFAFREDTALGERRLLLGGSGTYWRLVVWGHPHNIVLLTGETMGAVGLGVLAWLIIALAVSGMDLLRKLLSPDRRLLAVALAGAGAALAWSMFSLGQNVAYFPLQGWAFFGLAGAGYCLAHGGDDRSGLRNLVPARARELAARWRPAALPLLSGAIALAALGLVVRPAIAQSIAANARSEAQDGRITTAIDRYDLARWFDPLDAGLLQEVSRLELRTNDVPAAVASIKRQAEVEPDSASAVTQLGWAEWLGGDVAAATRSFQRSVELDPWNSLASNNWTALGLADIATGKRADAIAAFERALLLDPSAAAGPPWLPIQASTANDRLLDAAYFPSQGANIRLNQLIRQRLGQPIGNIETPALPPDAARTLHISEVLDSAMQDYQLQRRGDPRLNSSQRPGLSERARGMASALARAYSRAGLPNRAVELLLDLRANVPDRSYVSYDLGLAYAALGRNADAEAAFQTSLKLAQDSSSYDIYEPFSHYQLGVIYERGGDHTRALEQFRKTLDTYRWPYFPEAYRALAKAASETGHAAEARDTLDKLNYLLGSAATASSAQ